ncbi:MAG: hypothetical protein QOJ57_2397 [Thermoleophilaceae bacterium]|jgi:hypothetical protein|nr:hypothetical protein [Thermoleophilaceae bacterium]
MSASTTQHVSYQPTGMRRCACGKPIGPSGQCSDCARRARTATADSQSEAAVPKPEAAPREEPDGAAERSPAPPGHDFARMRVEPE